MKKFNLTFNKKLFKFAISDFIKNINFAIDEIEIVEIVFNESSISVIMINEYNNFFLITSI